LREIKTTLLILVPSLWALPWEPILATRCAELKDAYATIHRPGIDRDVYLVPDGFGRMDCAWRETNLEDMDIEDMDIEAIIGDLLEASTEPDPCHWI
jgi:hypothetical protein